MIQHARMRRHLDVADIDRFLAAGGTARAGLAGAGVTPRRGRAGSTGAPARPGRALSQQSSRRQSEAKARAKTGAKTRSNRAHDHPDGNQPEVALPGARRVIRPKSQGQAQYMEAIRNHDIVVGFGPAGTGKTYLAVAMALEALNRSRVRRIVLTRPAVEAGEALGFLPGDIQEKVDPYLRPLYDALKDMMPRDRMRRAIEGQAIEVAPLAYMRGRTLSDAFIILDEAQNSTTAQMKMFLTRLGLNSRAVITGDSTQVDLPNRRHSGLLDIERVLAGVDGIEFCYMDDADVVRHHLVRRIIHAYDQAEQSDKSQP
ncbi:MAG: PhoH family protein [Gemmatimonadetes bacterium]|nr:PhoH family protein [Gemmatimonadota bacterium]